MHREPEFSVDDFALLLALIELRAEEAARASEIGPHGRPMSEAMSAEADPNRRDAAWHYRPRVRVDHAARLLNRLQDQRAHDYPDEDRSSLRWSLERVDGAYPLTD